MYHEILPSWRKNNYLKDLHSFSERTAVYISKSTAEQIGLTADISGPPAKSLTQDTDIYGLAAN
jgi:hypothetical protein